MTYEEKVGQLIQLSIDYFGIDSEITGPAQERGYDEKSLSTIGSCIGAKDAKTLRNIQENHLKTDRNKIPMLFMLDVIHGYRTIYPIGLGLACSFDPQLVTECTEMAAKETVTGGVHVTFAPMVDLSRDARWGRVIESCGEDPYLASILGAAQVKAYQGDDISDSEHIAACVKHFAAYGGAESGKDYNIVDVSEHNLRQYYLPVYKSCVDAGVKMLMPSFNVLNGVPSTANPFLMKKILKDEWGFKGIIISDFCAISELCTHGISENLKDAARLAFVNGCHIEMISRAYRNHLAELVREGVFTENQLDEAVMSVLRFKDELGLFEDPYYGADDEKGNLIYLSNEHRAIARKGAEESAVLLKNDNVLPFDSNVKKVAVIGPYADSKEILGMWYALGRFEEAVSVKEGISELLESAEIVSSKGCGNLWSDTDKSGFANAIELAKKSEAVIICVGEPANYSGEASSRANIRLPGVQEELIKAVAKVNENFVVVLFNGRPLDLTEIYDCSPAIIETWFPGTEGGNAIANLLFGKANPCGKLAMSFPKSVGQCPVYYNRTITGRPKHKPDSEFQPFSSSYIDCGNLPLFFFGEGLSYSDFVYESMTLDKNEITADESVKVTVTLRNDGSFDGKEVVQLYLRDKVSSVVRPLQELIAFEKVFLKAGETKTIQFDIDEKKLRFWNADNEFVSEPGEFTISVGYADHYIYTCEFKLK